MWLQYAQGSLGLNMGFGNPIADSDVKSWRFVENMTWQVGALGGQAITLFQNDKGPGTSVDSFTIGGRASYALTKNLKLLSELGFSQKKPDTGETEHLTKITVGPALSTGPDFWKRPELRLYVTYADFNHAAAVDAANGLPVNETNGTSFGAQVEIWF
jgi:maltoporin